MSAGRAPPRGREEPGRQLCGRPTPKVRGGARGGCGCARLVTPERLWWLQSDTSHARRGAGARPFSRDRAAPASAPREPAGRERGPPGGGGGGRAAMAGQQFQYDDSGNTFFYFLTSFVGLIVIPATYYLWPRDQHAGEPGGGAGPGAGGAAGRGAAGAGLRGAALRSGHCVRGGRRRLRAAGLAGRRGWARGKSSGFDSGVPEVTAGARGCSAGSALHPARRSIVSLS